VSNLYRFVVAAILALAVSAHADEPQLGQLDASPTLFTVMAAINAAGFDADLSSPNNHPLRNAVRAELAKRNIPSLPAIKAFLAKHRGNNDLQELSQFISFALSVQGPPNFELALRNVETPPDVGPLADFSKLLAAFYKEADIPDLWKRSQPAIDQYIDRYHEPVTNAVTQVNAYLRQQTSGFRGRHFQIFIELLAPPNQVQTRSYGNEYTIVVTPSPELRVFEVRHAYLHYLLDPLATHNEDILERKKPIGDHALRAPLLPDTFKHDFLSLATECLIKAVEARIDKQPQKVQQALLEGYILTPYFAEKLPQYEKQESSMMIYYPEMVGAIDLRLEEARLSRVEFLDKSPATAAKPSQATLPPLTGAAKTLDAAENAYTARDLENAKKLYLEVLQQTDDRRLHADAYYGLARIAALQRDPETSDRLFQKTLEMQPEPQVKAWALIYLGRLAIAAGDREQAAKRFQEALSVEGASQKALEEARQGLQQISKP
jgi:tetratricopeptide (TPR) repeat protein